jgi:E3 ubiquitin-protein ligase MARCH6
VILPALLEQSQTRAWLKVVVHWWCVGVSYLLDLKSYLLGEGGGGEGAGGGNGAGEGGEGGEGGQLELRAAHQALLQRGGPTGFQPYHAPSLFPLRLVALILLVCVSLVIVSLVALTLPVYLGRKVMSLYPGLQGAKPAPVHELYTAACGTYLCWVGARAVTLVASWLPQGRAAGLRTLYSWTVVVLKSSCALALLFGLVPLLCGLLLELVLVVPLRVPLDQTPVLWLWQDWALGLLYTKIVCAVTMMGPDWALRQAIERVYRDGLRNMQLDFIVTQLAAPVISVLSLALAVPYAMAHSIAPLFLSSTRLQIQVSRSIYPFLLLVMVVCAVLYFQLKQFTKLYEHIKNDKYLVGRRLVNYHHKAQLQQQQTTQ